MVWSHFPAIPPQFLKHVLSLDFSMEENRNQTHTDTAVSPYMTRRRGNRCHLNPTYQKARRPICSPLPDFGRTRQETQFARTNYKPLPLPLSPGRTPLCKTILTRSTALYRLSTIRTYKEQPRSYTYDPERIATVASRYE